KKYLFIDGKIDKISTDMGKGVGIRIVKDDLKLYHSTSLLEEGNLNYVIDQLKKMFTGSRHLDEIHLNEMEVPISRDSVTTSHHDYGEKRKKDFLYRIDQIARSYSDKVIQIEVMLYESDQEVQIANSLGKLAKDERMLTRLFINIMVKDQGKTTNSYKTFGSSGGDELLDTLAIEDIVKKLVDSALNKLTAKPCPGGDMPVIIGPGFGAVIIHEACGHALEATSVARNLSILCGKKGQRIAKEKVTIVDDGTLPNEWGTVAIDDEGNLAQKNILIENGILKKYFVDYLNASKVKQEITGSGRRQDYRYAPTSRMNNTYLLAGNDSIDEMIQSISFGLYAKQMGGGSVDPVTGDFNFSVLEAYMIRDGKLAEMVEGASLIGNTLDIMNQIEMVSDDLLIETGWCGSESGQVPVTCGQPTIKISKILVGGGKSD
ncbi:MAG: TldD/PmbA family protein, partial [bacterium]|nr:TldD/PmbA family protein [bacterium]